ncbi:MAG: hypothetical protein ACHQ9S_22575 [Candidatus Binatia bacterium]
MRPKSLLLVLGLLGASFGVGSWTAGVTSAQSGTCVGDCGADGQVTVDEILTMVNIALGNANVSICTAGDVNSDGQITVDEILTAVNYALQGCQSTPTPTKTPAPPTPTPTRTPTMTSELELFDVGANFFSIRKPKGWDIHIGGVCSTLGILIRDPAVPLRQIFYFGLIGPVYLKEAQRQIDQDYINHGGYNLITWLDAPAVDPLTTENFFVHWPGIAAMKAATDFMPQFPKLTGLTVVSNTPLSSMFPNGNSALLRALFMENGAVGEAQLLGSVWVYWPFTGIPGGGTGYGSILLGVSAPKGEFKDVQARLIASLESFAVTQGYIDWCLAQQRQLWGAVAQAGQTLRETSDMIFDGWQNRSHSSDIMAEIDSDTMRGVERVYDPSINQVYEVPADWYTNYDAHRGEYTMNDLQLLPPDNWELWTSAPADGSGIH